MPWRNHITKYYQPHRPIRVRLPDGTTRTGEEITDELLADLGWQWEEPIIESLPNPIIPLVTTATTTATEITFE